MRPEPTDRRDQVLADLQAMVADHCTGRCDVLHHQVQQAARAALGPDVSVDLVHGTNNRVRVYLYG